MCKGSRFENGLISNRNIPPLIQNEVGATMVLVDDKNSIRVKSEGFEVSGNSGLLELTLPIHTVSEANGLLSKERFYKNGKPKPEHWTEKSARHKSQKHTVYAFLSPLKSKLSLPCTVKMVRVAPNELDADDNLRISLKWIKDAIAEILTQDFVPGRADSDKRIKWEYDQEKSKTYGVKLQIWN